MDIAIIHSAFRLLARVFVVVSQPVYLLCRFMQSLAYHTVRLLS